MGGYQITYRCQYDGLDPAGCGWSTEDYSEIDAHEGQLDPGHFVIASKETPHARS